MVHCLMQQMLRQNVVRLLKISQRGLCCLHSLLLSLSLSFPPFPSFLVGHRTAIKCLCVQDSEHLFLSGSKDRTVKLWSLHNQGDGNSNCSCRQSYNMHQRPVSNVSMVGPPQALSCDGSVHVSYAFVMCSDWN